jgi:ATP-NAD kinase N-terminal domain
MVCVGVVANPASGRDVRRLVTGASVFDNAEKGAMVHRLMAGLGATGVDRVVMMPAGSGVSQSLHRHLSGRTSHLAAQRLPELEVLDMALFEDARDSAAAVRAMAERQVAAIVVLGGDGTHRVVAAHCGDIPLCALSTGTNNAFPELREATVAGMATGLVATGRLGGDGLVRRAKRFRVGVNGDAVVDSALVDVAVTAERWVGSRALWRVEAISEALVTFASPSAVGLTAVAGAVDPVPRAAPFGLHLSLAPPERAPREGQPLLRPLRGRPADLPRPGRGRRAAPHPRLPGRLRRPVTAAAEVTAEDLRRVDDEAVALIDDTVAQAKAAPEPDPADLLTDVYVRY